MKISIFQCKNLVFELLKHLLCQYKHKQKQKQSINIFSFASFFSDFSLSAKSMANVMAMTKIIIPTSKWNQPKSKPVLR